MYSRRIDRSLKRTGDPPGGSLFAKPWMTTIGLMAVNVSLIAVLIGGPRATLAQQIPSIPVCNWCYERQHRVNNHWYHTTKKGRGWSRVEGMTIHHRNDGAYLGSCWSAHFWAGCCDPGKN